MTTQSGHARLAELPVPGHVATLSTANLFEWRRWRTGHALPNAEQTELGERDGAWSVVVEAAIDEEMMNCCYSYGNGRWFPVDGHGAIADDQIAVVHWRYRRRRDAES